MHVSSKTRINLYTRVNIEMVAFFEDDFYTRLEKTHAKKNVGKFSK